MSQCKICGNQKSKFHMGNKLVCMKCDELLFDLEIECDEDAPETKKTSPTVEAKPVVVRKTVPATKK